MLRLHLNEICLLCLLKWLPQTEVNIFSKPSQIEMSESDNHASHPHEGNSNYRRTSNWTDSLDAIMLTQMTEEHALGNFVNGAFTTLAWTRIVNAFNQKAKLDFKKNQLQNRLKVLKRIFGTYQYLANKSGWGWDPMLNIPTAGDPTDWDAVIRENPSYAKCREKPFPAYKDIEFLTGKTTATGRHGFTSQMPVGHEPIDSSSSSSPGHADVLEALRNSMINDSEQGQSSRAHMNVDTINEATSLSPSPDPVNPSTPHIESASGHSSAGKRARSSPSPTRRHKQQTRGGRNKNTTISNDRLGELADIGRQRLDIAKAILKRELIARPIVHSIEECMDRLRMINGVTPERCLTALEAFKDDRNRTIFLALGDDIALAWIDQQAVLQGFAGPEKPN
ncbi:uncharacterized protein LOC109705818 isoform X1 [Ananas comosus]|uniref:Uncharacterized protein LOC109705818 isoform X1 n=2 Tax=Ananas comosus TaxID=4615 RepID=A0A6P5EFY4_ANACO|nr:uncharacterized protein LOC109705818 isoform X1 [Ananas comosus]